SRSDASASRRLAAGCFVLALHLVSAWALMHMMPARLIVREQVVMASILPKTRPPPPPMVPRFTPLTPPTVSAPIPLVPPIKVEPAPTAIRARPTPPSPQPSPLPGKASALPSSTYLTQLMAHLAAAKRYPYESGTRA